MLSDWPITRPADWLSLVNSADSQSSTDQELITLRASVNRGRPFGSEQWVAETTENFGLQSTIRPIGRPAK